GRGDRRHTAFAERSTPVAAGRHAGGEGVTAFHHVPADSDYTLVVTAWSRYNATFTTGGASLPEGGLPTPFPSLVFSAAIWVFAPWFISMEPSTIRRTFNNTYIFSIGVPDFPA